MVDRIRTRAAACAAKEHSISSLSLREGVLLVPERRLRSTVHAPGIAEASRKQIPPGYLAYRPTYQAGTVEADFTILPRWIVVCWAAAGAPAPGILLVVSFNLNSKLSL